MKKIANLINSFLCISFLFLSLSCSQKLNADYTVDYNSFDYSKENNFKSEWMINEDNFIQEMKDTVEPYLADKMTAGTVACPDGNKIHYESFTAENSKGVIVLFHGFCEFTHKFNEQTFYFLKAGYSVVRFDHLGHGLSSRKIENPSKVHTENFEDYVDNANEVVQKIAVPLSKGKPLYLFAHSMGGGIGTYYIEKYPDVFSKVVLNCPMIEINTGKLGELNASILTNFMCLIGNGKGYIPGNRDFDYTKDSITIDEINHPTVSFIRKQYFCQFRFNDINYITNGATYRWTQQSLSATKKIRSKEQAAKIKVPVLLFQSRNDKWVNPKGQDILRKNSASVKVAYYPEVEHEIFASHNKYLYKYYDMILSFYEE